LFTSSGADLVLPKPLDVDLLTSTIQSRFYRSIPHCSFCECTVHLPNVPCYEGKDGCVTSS